MILAPDDALVFRNIFGILKHNLLNFMIPHSVYWIERIGISFSLELNLMRIKRAFKFAVKSVRKKEKVVKTRENVNEGWQMTTIYDLSIS